ncbi:hypothetical protein CKA32_000343 [Geitlerinema sp. FC II]|nr:hypothetical protein CKA32_000343 [Geitlerinema sp. FC II]
MVWQEGDRVEKELKQRRESSKQLCFFINSKEFSGWFT